jgi:hypothetical protein
MDLNDHIHRNVSILLGARVSNGRIPDEGGARQGCRIRPRSIQPPSPNLLEQGPGAFCQHAAPQSVLIPGLPAADQLHRPGSFE